jgi:hypothetical protein
MGEVPRDAEGVLDGPGYLVAPGVNPWGVGV